jgi:copper chaperone
MLIDAVLPLKRRGDNKIRRCMIARVQTVELQVEGMDCQGCVKSVTRMLNGVAGVENVDVSLEAGRARIIYDPAKAGPAEFKRAIERAGYKAP